MKKIINFRPFLFLALSLISGILSAYFYVFENRITAILISLIFLGLNIIYLVTQIKIKNIKRSIIFCCAFILIFCFGYMSFSLQVNNYKNANLEGHIFNIEGKVSFIEEEENGCSVLVSAVKLDGKVSGKVNYNILLYVTGNSNIQLGDNISFTQSLTDRTLIYNERFCAEAVVDKIKWTASCNAQEITINHSSANLFEKSNIFIKNSLKSGLDKQEFGTAYALLVGNCDYFSTYLLNNYRSLGIAHIFAVSGLHIGFLAGILLLLFKRIPINKFIKFFIISLILLFYSGICGFSASSLRAVIMCSIMMLARTLGERYDGLSSLSFAALLILIFSPSQLFCVGFILSFLVVLSIILFSKLISKIFKFLPSKIANVLGVLFSAQIASVPILIDYFGNFSFISIISNLIFVPFVSVIYTLLFVGTILGGIFSISHIFLYPSNLILKGVNFVVGILDYSVFTIACSALGFAWIFYYACLIVSCDIINIKKISKIICISALSIAFVACSITNVFVNNNKVSICVMGYQNISATVVVDNGKSSLIISQANKIYSQNQVSNLLKFSRVKTLDSVILLNDGKEKDVQVFVSRLTHVVDVKSLIYHKDMSIEGLQVLEKSFPNIAIKRFSDKDNLLLNLVELEYDLKGYCIKLTYKDNNFVIFSKFGENYAKYTGIEDEIDKIIAYDYLDNINSHYKNAQIISYRQSKIYKNAEKEGLIKFSI